MSKKFTFSDAVAFYVEREYGYFKLDPLRNYELKEKDIKSINKKYPWLNIKYCDEFDCYTAAFDETKCTKSDYIRIYKHLYKEQTKYTDKLLNKMYKIKTILEDL